MGLVEYSDSDGSGDESAQASSKQSGPQKLVNKANPHKITVSLPAPRQQETNESTNDPTPPAKRQKVGGGMNDFMAMLPAPKNKAGSATKPKGGSLGKGVSLRTGAEPAFSREPAPVFEYDEGRDTAPADEPAHETPVAQPEEVKPTGNAIRFKPLSVARKPQKKKVALSSSSTSNASKGLASSSQDAMKPEQATPKPFSKLSASLFPTAEPEEPIELAPATEAEDAADPGELEGYEGDISAGANYGQPVHADVGSDTLDTIASDLNLSASARRQLLGRGSRGSNVKVANFNVNAEYSANENARRTGEQAEQQNTVRSIAPGKHSLRQLVNAVTGQREALEEQFASGRRNKKESGSKYGW